MRVGFKGGSELTGQSDVRLPSNPSTFSLLQSTKNPDARKMKGEKKKDLERERDERREREREREKKERRREESVCVCAREREEERQRDCRHTHAQTQSDILPETYAQHSPFVSQYSSSPQRECEEQRPLRIVKPVSPIEIPYSGVEAITTLEAPLAVAAIQ